MIFLHGFLGSARDWEKVCSYLPSFDCHCIELPGHGTTPFTDDFASLFPPLEKMDLIGYSMGGRIALYYAEKFPERVNSLTLLSTHTGLQKGKEERWQTDLSWANEIVSSFDDFLKKWYAQPIFAGFIPDLTMRRKHNPQALAQSLLHYSLSKQPLFSPKNALFVVGEKDKKYRELYPQAIVIPNAGHCVHLEQPEKIAKLLNRRFSS